ncbi:hypothetical protein [Sphingomonas sp. S-NIH.Pt3_0716]|uniref:hypothetical protein n=1 Tax=Rhizobium sp. TaxID=391 RepID=UPI000F7F9854|nr:hypothetical protein BRX37_24750 [Sphingomonas sp. S-NIH.Pt3_0716]
MNGSTFSLANASMVAVLLVTQILAVSLVPRTAGFTNLPWTLALLAVYTVSMWSLASIVHSGMPLGLIMPVIAALVPLASIGIGVIFYKEAVSMLKIVLLCSACGLIGLASAVK